MTQSCLPHRPCLRSPRVVSPRQSSCLFHTFFPWPVDERTRVPRRKSSSFSESFAEFGVNYLGVYILAEAYSRILPVGKNGSVAVDGFGGSPSRNPSWLAIRPQMFVWLRRRDDVANSLRWQRHLFVMLRWGHVFFTLPEVVEHVPELAPLLCVSISSSISECLCPKHLASRSSYCCAHLRHRLPELGGVRGVRERGN